MPRNRMLEKNEVETYAHVLLEAAKAKGRVYEVSAQLQEVQAAVLDHPNLHAALVDETLSDEARRTILAEVFKGFDEELLDVIGVMSDRRDMGLLHRVVGEFGAQAEEAMGVVIIDVTTVVELDDELRRAIKEKYAGHYEGKEIVLREHVDPSILGGIVLGAHGRRIDASIATQLEQTRAALSAATTGGER